MHRVPFIEISPTKSAHFTHRVCGARPPRLTHHWVCARVCACDRVRIGSVVVRERTHWKRANRMAFLDACRVVAPYLSHPWSNHHRGAQLHWFSLALSTAGVHTGTSTRSIWHRWVAITRVLHSAHDTRLYSVYYIDKSDTGKASSEKKKRIVGWH